VPAIPEAEHPVTARIRALGQVLVCLLIWFLLQTLLTIPMVVQQGLPGSSGEGSGGPSPLALTAPTIQTMMVTSVIGVLATLGAVAWMVRRHGLWQSLRDYGLGREGNWLRETALGLALGPIVFGVVLAVGMAFGWVRELTFRPDVLGVLQGLLVALLVAFSEEILMRGYVFQTLLPGWGLRTSLLLQAVLFASLHGFNPGVSQIALLQLVASGLLLGYAWKVTRRLWLPVALHLSWNFAQGSLFGFPVSGISFPAFLSHQVDGPAWVLGGAFGPEAGLLGLGAMGLAFLAIYLWGRSRSAEEAAG